MLGILLSDTMAPLRSTLQGWDYISFAFYFANLFYCQQETRVYTSADELESDYRSGVIHPSDLKPAVTDAINTILEPVRRHFSSGVPKQLLDKIKKFKVTR